VHAGETPNRSDVFRVSGVIRWDICRRLPGGLDGEGQASDNGAARRVA
jgi:hypothetical protein